MDIAAKKRIKLLEKKKKFNEDQNKYQRDRVQISRIHEGLRAEKMQKHYSGAPS